MNETLFKHSSELLLASLPMLQEDNFTNQVEEFGKLLKPVLSIGKLSCKLDQKSMAFIWKLVLKTLKKNSKICQEKEIVDVVQFILQDSLPYFLALLLNPANINKSGKIVGFLSKVVVGFFDIIPVTIAEHVNDTLINLILQLYR